jgi:sucrose phosphorylase
LISVSSESDKDMKNLGKQLYEHIEFIYGQDQVATIYQSIQGLLDRFQLAHPGLSAVDPKDRLSELDAILITYGDMVQAQGQAPLQTTGAFFKETISDIISTIHFLPFFPYSSDDGFSVIDYYQVNPDYGDWEDIAGLREHFRLMFDAVVNHISAKSEWFRAFLAGKPKYKDYFYVVDGDFDTSKVFRPRALPLLTEFDTPTGSKKVWTTFSEDQIDLNYECPEILLEVIQVLLKYVAEGAEFIRLDAIAFIWKESGTRCLHQPQTHRIIQLMRTILDMVAPGVSLITETNVPHEDNISYFGDGFNEAQMVYNFSLPPLTLHALQTGNAAVLTKWAAELSIPSNQTTFFNFLASHDGIGLMPAHGFLSQDEIAAMAERVLALGGLVSYKNNPDGTQSPYELNINYLDALGNPEKSDEDVEQVARRFLITQSIMLILRGVPGIYFHSLFGSRNWTEGVAQTGRNRTINRQKLLLDQLRQELADPDSLRHSVFKDYHRMLQLRRANPAFHPMAGQQILDLGSAVFAVFRFSVDQESQILCLHNATDKSVDLEIDLSTLSVGIINAVIELLTETTYQVVDSKLSILLSPYQISWLKMQ